MRDVEANAPSIRGNLDNCTTVVVLSTEIQEDDIPELSPANDPLDLSRPASRVSAKSCGIQVIFTPKTSCRQSLHHYVDFHSVPKTSNVAQDSEPNSEPSAHSVPAEKVHDVNNHNTVVVTSSETQEDDKPELPPANVRCIQATVPTISRPSTRSLRDDSDIHITSVIPSNQNLIHILPRDPSDLSRQVSQVSAESTYSELQNTWIWKIITFLHFTQFAAMAGVPMSGSASIPNHSKRVHTFYAQALSFDTPIAGHIEQQPVLTACVGAIGMAFAAIHCIAWHFSFPTHLEQTIWRVSALLIVFAPNLFVLLPLFGLTEYVLTDSDPCTWYALTALRGIVMLSILITLFFYFPARVYLLVEACISLRSLPPSALEDVKWTSFIPHLA